MRQIIKATRKVLTCVRDVTDHVIKQLEKHENPVKKREKPAKGVLTEPPRL